MKKLKIPEKIQGLGKEEAKTVKPAFWLALLSGHLQRIWLCLQRI